MNGLECDYSRPGLQPRSCNGSGDTTKIAGISPRRPRSAPAPAYPGYHPPKARHGPARPPLPHTRAPGTCRDPREAREAPPGLQPRGEGLPSALTALCGPRTDRNKQRPRGHRQPPPLRPPPASCACRRRHYRVTSRRGARESVSRGRCRVGGRRWRAHAPLRWRGSGRERWPPEGGGGPVLGAAPVLVPYLSPSRWLALRERPGVPFLRWPGGRPRGAKGSRASACGNRPGFRAARQVRLGSEGRVVPPAGHGARWQPAVSARLVPHREGRLGTCGAGGGAAGWAVRRGAVQPPVSAVSPRGKACVLVKGEGCSQQDLNLGALTWPLRVL